MKNPVSRRPRLSAGTSMLALVLFPLAAGAADQPYPNRPVRLVTAAAGGGNDFAARMIAPGLTEKLGQQVIVDNRGGAHVPANLVAKAAPDGHTILVQNNTIWVAPLLEKTAYDHFRELAPLMLTGRAPNVLVVHPSLPVSSVKELIAAAKAAPGTINYASGVAGSSNHVAAELFKAMAGVDLVRISYKGSGPALIDVMAGQVKLIFSTTTSSMSHVKSGKLKALAITSAQRSDLAPGLPTVAESGVPGYVAEAIYGVWLPAKTPASIMKRLHQDIVQVLTTPQVKERFVTTGAEIVASTPEVFAAEIKAESTRLEKIFRSAGIKAE